MTAPAVSLHRSQLADFLELTKPRIVLMVLVTVAAGFALAPGSAGAWTLVHALIGTALVAAGTGTLNQLIERDVDARMLRTRRRPLPGGRVDAAEAGVFGWSLAAVGTTYLLVAVNLATAALAAATVLSYVLVYTPLKRRTPAATLIGAIPGALPIVGGWTAAGSLPDAGAWALFWILFLWQLPHFQALSWMYRDDYARAGLRMQSVDDPDGRATFRTAAAYAAALLPVAILPSALGVAGGWYAVGAASLSLWFLGTAVVAVVRPSFAAARRLFLASLAWLPLVLALMVADRAA